MTPDLSLRPLDVRLRSKHVFTQNGDLDRALFQLLRQEDLYMSMAWHSIWHGLERTPWPTPC